MKPNPITKQLSEFAENNKIAQIARTVGLSRRGLRACLSPDKPIESFKVGTLLKFTRAFPMTIIISSGQVTVFRWTIPLKKSPDLNPIAKLLTTFVRNNKSSATFIADQMALSRRTLYDCMRPDKEVASYKLGTLLKFTSLFPLTVVISDGSFYALNENKKIINN